MQTLGAKYSCGVVSWITQLGRQIHRNLHLFCKGLEQNGWSGTINFLIPIEQSQKNSVVLDRRSLSRSYGVRKSYWFVRDKDCNGLLSIETRRLDGDADDFPQGLFLFLHLHSKSISGTHV